MQINYFFLQITGVILLIILSINVYGEIKDDHRLKISSSYREESIDYNDEKRQLIKNKMSFYFSRESEFNFALLYTLKEKEQKYTWNILLKDIFLNSVFIIGNFNINYGTGLILGKKSYISSDPFSTKIILSSSKPYTPVNSGNPVYSFNGISFSKKYIFENFNILYSGFYSIRDRYIQNDSYENESISSSISSVNLKIDQSYNYFEPASIIDYGGFFELILIEKFHFQIYGFNTELYRGKNNSILWSYSNDELYMGGTESYKGAGLFLEYRDKYISLFSESVLSQNIIKCDEEDNLSYVSYALLNGLKFKNRITKFSLVVKTTDPSYYAPYSSGKNYAEDTWKFSASLKAHKKVIIGFSLYSQKKISPSNNETFLKGKRQEDIFIKYKFYKKIFIKLDFKKVSQNEENSVIKKYQSKIKIKIIPSKNIKLIISGKALYKGRDDISYSAGFSSSIVFFKQFNLSLYYTIYFISNNNSIYSAGGSEGVEIVSGSYMSESLNSAAVKLSYRYKKNRFKIKYGHRFTFKKNIKKTIEFSGEVYY